MELVDYIVFLAFIFSTVPVVLFFFRNQSQNFSNELSAIKPFLWLLFIGSIYEIVFTRILKVPSGFWFTLFTFLEFLTIWYFFKRLFYNKYRNLFLFFFFLILVGFIIVLIYWEDAIHQKLEGYLSVPISVFIFTYVFIYFKKLFKQSELMPLWQSPTFYFISGLMVYFSVGVLASLLIYDIWRLTGLFHKYWMVYIGVGYFMRIMMAVGIWKATDGWKPLKQ